MSKQLDLVISILKESATAHKIGDTVWAKDSVKRYITHAGKIVDISPGKITIKKLSGALTTHNTEDVSKDYEHLNPNPYRKNESEEIEESFTVKDASGKVVHVALTQSAAEKKAAELQASTKEKHTAGYSREAVVKEEWNAAYAEGKRHGSQGTGNNGQKAKKDWGDDFHHYNRGFLEGRNAKAKSLKAVGQGYGKKTNEAEDLEELNKSTIDSYKEKATDELKQAKKYSKSEYGDIAKRIMARRTSGLSRVLKRNESEEDLDESANPLTQNLPGKSTHITKKDIRHSDGGIVLGSTALRNVEGDKYEIRSGRYRGKVATFHPDNLRKIDEECVSEGIIKKKKPHPEHPYHEKTNAELKQVMNLGDAEKGKVASAILNYRGNWDKAPVRVKESSLEDLHTGKGDGKELKASPEYRRDRRRTAQMLAAQKEVQARVKRGYAEDDKDLDESLDEAHKLGDRVKIVGGVSKDVIGVHGHIGEIRNGAFKGAPKTYTVDYQHPKHSSKNTRSIQLSKEHIRGAKPETLGEGLDEAKMVMPLARHPYHTKSDEELRGIVKDAGETARVQKGMSSEGKYLDQMNDASTVLHYRSKGGKREGNLKEANKTSTQTHSSNEGVENLEEISLKTKINAFAARSAEEYIDDWDFGKTPDKIGDNILRKHGPEAMKSAEKAAHVANFGRTDASGKSKNRPYDPLNPTPWEKTKEHKFRKDGKIHKTETNGLKWNVSNRLKNWYKTKPNLPESVELEELDTATLKSYSEKARKDAEKLAKQGDAAKTDKTKLAKYVKATKRHLNAHKADDKISSNEFYGKK